MTKKKKKESKLKAKINEMKKTPKGAAIVKLIGYIIFFVLLALFCLISSLIASVTPSKNSEPAKKEPITEPVDEPTKDLDIYNLNIKGLISLEQKILNNNYRYNYEITINEEKYIFNGNHSKDSDTGYKESNTGIIKYFIDNTGIYQETTSELILITSIYDNLNANYFDLSYLFGLINTLDMTKDLECDCVYPVYKLEDNENIYQISLENNQINSINIISKNNEYNYNLNYIIEGE